eukprot:1965489-Amphidinium_carterae.1
MLTRSICPHCGHAKFRNQLGLTGRKRPGPGAGRRPCRRTQAGATAACSGKQASLLSLFQWGQWSTM